MINLEEIYLDTIRKGIIYAQVEPRIEMTHYLELDVRSQEEVRAAASIILMYANHDLLTRTISPFQASHAIKPRKVNGRSPGDYMNVNPNNTPHLVPEDLKPVLDELIFRGWEQALMESGYEFNQTEGLAYAIETSPYEDYPEVFDPVLLVVVKPALKDKKKFTKSKQKKQQAFENLERYLTGGFGIGMRRFDPRK